MEFPFSGIEPPAALGLEDIGVPGQLSTASGLQAGVSGENAAAAQRGGPQGGSEPGDNYPATRGSSEGGTGANGQGSVTAYLGSLKRQIETNKTYPAFSRRRGEEGKVEVCFSVNRKGNIESAGIVKSSGYVRLDEAALKAVRRSSPFPPPPRLGGGILRFSVVLAFELAS